MARGLYCMLIAAILSLMFPLAALAAEVHPARIAFVGDSMADGLWGAMFRRIGKNKCLAEKVTLIRKAKNGTGLARLDQFNWVEEMKTLAKDGNVDLFIGSFGINDRQAIVEPDKTRVEFGSPQYDAKYKAVLSEAVHGVGRHEIELRPGQVLGGPQLQLDALDVPFLLAQFLPA